MDPHSDRMLEARQKWEAKTSAGRNRIQQLELFMNAACPVALTEIANDRPVSAHQLSVRSEIRMEVIDVAERIIRGEKTNVLRYGIPYTKDQAMIDFVEHSLCDDAVLAAWNGDRMPLTDLLTRIVQRVVAVAWYGEATADDLGFAK